MTELYELLNSTTCIELTIYRYLFQNCHNNINTFYLLSGYSPTRCTQEEIKRKHQQAREKLLAKRLLPFTSTQQSAHVLPTQVSHPVSQTPKKTFQPKVASSIQKLNNLKKNPLPNNNVNLNLAPQQSATSSADIKILIEKKRQEALMKLRRRQPQKP